VSDAKFFLFIRYGSCNDGSCNGGELLPFSSKEEAILEADRVFQRNIHNDPTCTVIHGEVVHERET
jgi:hypothetical protein